MVSTVNKEFYFFLPFFFFWCYWNLNSGPMLARGSTTWATPTALPSFLIFIALSNTSSVRSPLFPSMWSSLSEFFHLVWCFWDPCVTVGITCPDNMHCVDRLYLICLFRVPHKFGWFLLWSLWMLLNVHVQVFVRKHFTFLGRYLGVDFLVPMVT
jgi:hypothetical protein